MRANRARSAPGCQRRSTLSSKRPACCLTRRRRSATSPIRMASSSCTARAPRPPNLPTGCSARARSGSASSRSNRSSTPAIRSMRRWRRGSADRPRRQAPIVFLWPQSFVHCPSVRCTFGARWARRRRLWLGEPGLGIPGNVRYLSTRGEAPRLGFCDAMLAGLARDGGLYTPEHVTRVEPAAIRALSGIPYAEAATRLVAPYVGEDFSALELSEIATDAYGEFRHAATAPLV